MTHRCGRRIIFRGDELDVLVFEAEIINGFLDQVRVFVAYLAKLYGGHADEQNSAAGVAIARRFEPGIVRVPIDLFFQRVQDA